MATSVPFAALVLTDMAACFGAFTFMTNWPTYLKFMLGLDIKTNGLLSALPFICRSPLMAVLKQNEDKLLCEVVQGLKRLVHGLVLFHLGKRKHKETSAPCKFVTITNHPHMYQCTTNETPTHLWVSYLHLFLLNEGTSEASSTARSRTLSTRGAR